MLKIIKPKIYTDRRGQLFELNKFEFISISSKDTIRGMHYQWGQPREKLITIINGSIIDKVVNINSVSEEYKKIESNILKTSEQLFIPAYFAHGFRALEENTIVLYQCNCRYSQKYEESIDPFDKELNIDWGIEIDKILISHKDKNGIPFSLYKERPRFV